MGPRGPMAHGLMGPGAHRPMGPCPYGPIGPGSWAQGAGPTDTRGPRDLGCQGGTHGPRGPGGDPWAQGTQGWPLSQDSRSVTRRDTLTRRSESKCCCGVRRHAIGPWAHGPWAHGPQTPMQSSKMDGSDQYASNTDAPLMRMIAVRE